MGKFQECRFGRVALYMAALEPLIIWGLAMALYAMHFSAPIWLARGLRLVYTLGLFSIILAIVGLKKDSQQGNAAFALSLGLVNLVLCVVPIVR
jgi:hypothetical protein